MGDIWDAIREDYGCLNPNCRVGIIHPGSFPKCGSCGWIRIGDESIAPSNEQETK